MDEQGEFSTFITRWGSVSMEEDKRPYVGSRRTSQGRWYLSGNTKRKSSSRRWQGHPLGRGRVHAKSEEAEYLRGHRMPRGLEARSWCHTWGWELLWYQAPLWVHCHMGQEKCPCSNEVESSAVKDTTGTHSVACMTLVPVRSGRRGAGETPRSQVVAGRTVITKGLLTTG